MDPPRRPAAIGSRQWIATLAALTAVVALSVDMSLPAQPVLAQRFGVLDETAQLTLSVFLIGYAFAQLVVGYLADAWGRRSVLLAGLALFTVAGIACAVSPTIEVLIACRVVQGFGAAAPPVVARAMVRDTQPPREAARLLSTMLAALAIAPMIAPLFGSGLLAVLDWRAIFVTLAACGAALYVIARLTLVETLAPELRTRASARGLVRNFRTFFSTRGTRLPLLIGCASFAGQFAYIADSPFVLMGGYHVSRVEFSVYFGSTALALMIGSLSGGAILRAGRPPRVMIVAGSVLLLLGGVLITIGTRLDGLGIAGFLPPMILYFFGVGLASPSAIALALEPVPQIAGTASAAIGFCTMMAGALAGYETTKIGGTSPRLFALVVAAMAVAAMGLAIAIAIAPRPRR